ncbi:glycosyltransferase [Flavobacterium sp. Arc3]|uniref:glycosyltransferase n=1 Tax=Flavobacterium sp. Arc3 TaxID=3046686 RepID=UPI00352CACB7
MKVLHICYTDNIGGAAKAALRFHYALKKNSIDTTMLVYKKTLNDPSIIEMSSFAEKIFAYLGFYFQRFLISFFKKRKGSDFSIMCFPDKGLVRKINKLNPDIVHFHYLGPGIISIKGLSLIKQKIVWTLHDSFIFTGGCHTTYDCLGYQNSCGACNYLNSEKENDISKKLWKKKFKYLHDYGNINLTAPSNWMKICAESSSIFKNKNVTCIPNLIDTEIYTAKSKVDSKSFFGISSDVKIITTGGSNFEFDANKGMMLFLDSLQYLDNKNNVEIFIFGTKKEGREIFKGFTLRYLGYIGSQDLLVSLFSASDVVVVPSKQESFGQVAIEAMACGSPVVAFNTSGLKDILEHKVNGYLAQTFDVQDLAKGIQFVLSNDLSENAFKTVSFKFSENIVVNNLIEFYKI